jgi:hypothetical protein
LRLGRTLPLALIWLRLAGRALLAVRTLLVRTLALRATLAFRTPCALAVFLDDPFVGIVLRRLGLCESQAGYDRHADQGRG